MIRVFCSTPLRCGFGFESWSQGGDDESSHGRGDCVVQGCRPEVDRPQAQGVPGPGDLGLLGREHLESGASVRLVSPSGPPRHFFLSFQRFSIGINYCTYTLYLLTITKATTNIVERCENVPQKPRFSPNAGFAIRPRPPILMRWPWPLTLFPDWSSGGANVPSPHFLGTTATIPPLTPLLPGNPVSYSQSPEFS